MAADEIIKSEIIVLGTIMTNNSYILKAMDFILPEDLYRTSHKIIYKTMIKLYKGNISFDSVVLINNLRKEIQEGITTVSEISEIGTYGEENTFYSHLKLIKEASNNRRINTVCKDIIQSNADSNIKIEQLQKLILDTTTSDKEDTYLTMNEAVEDTIYKIDEAYRSNRGFTGISSGIVMLDKALNGLEKGTMTVFGARPSMGKTAFSLEILKGLEGNVLYVQMDMTIEGMIQRILSSYMGVENRKVGRGSLNDKEWQKLLNTASFLQNKRNIFFYKPKKPTISKILLRAKEIKAKYGLDAIIIDHIGKIIPHTKGSRYEQMTAISGALKNIALDLNISMIILCQLSRAVEQRQDKRPMLSDLRDTGAIEEDADNIGMLYRDGYYKERETNNKVLNDILELHLLKVRNGMLGVINFEYNLQTQTLTQILDN